jgi:hypothetical protein
MSDNQAEQPAGTVLPVGYVAERIPPVVPPRAPTWPPPWSAASEGGAWPYQARALALDIATREYVGRTPERPPIVVARARFYLDFLLGKDDDGKDA